MGVCLLRAAYPPLVFRAYSYSATKLPTRDVMSFDIMM